MFLTSLDFRVVRSGPSHTYTPGSAYKYGTTVLGLKFKKISSILITFNAIITFDAI